MHVTYRSPDAKLVLSNPDLRGTVSRPQPKPFFPGGTGHCVIPDFDRHPYPDLVLRSIIDKSQVTHYWKDNVHFGVCPIRQTVQKIVIIPHHLQNKQIFRTVSTIPSRYRLEKSKF